MTALTTQVEATSIRSVGVASGAGGTSLAPQNLGDVVRFAEVMSKADIALPKHLRGNPGACMAVAMQALEWGMSPFAVASKSYSVNGTIAYEAQLVAAVVNTRSGIKGRLRYTFTGEGGSLQCTVTGNLDGEDFSYTSPRFDQITTKNSPLWKSDPQQQLGYFAARSWARRYTPEVLLGVYDRDEMDEPRDITPSSPGIAARLAKPVDGPNEGFTASTTIPPAPPPSAPADEPRVLDVAGFGVIDVSPVDDAAHSAPTSSPVADQAPAAEPPAAAGADLSDEAMHAVFLAARQMIGAASAGGAWDEVRPVIVSINKGLVEAHSDAKDKSMSVIGHVKAWIDGTQTKAVTMAMIAGLVSVEEHELEPAQ